PTPLSAAAPRAANAAPPAASEPTAAAPATRLIAVDIKSPPVKAGAPPRTAENSFGICQHNIMKMTAAPMMSNAPIIGLEDADMVVAAVSQSTAKFRPAPINR